MQQPCPNCGAYVRPGALFCGTCGQAISARPAMSTAVAPLPYAPPTAMPSVGYLQAADGRHYSLTGQVTRIGRSYQCSLQLPDDSVSSVHAEIEVKGSSFVIRDLGSTNGTFVNNIGVRHEMQLNPGDQVAFGYAVFTFQSSMPALQGYSPALPPAPAWPTSPPVPAPAVPPLPAWQPQSIPQPIPLSAPDWGRHQPDLEGKVIHMDGPHQEKLSMWGRAGLTGCLALAGLGPLAFLPMFGHREITVYHLRLEDSHTGAQRAVKMRGDTSTQISQGDMVALWGKWDGGTLLVQKAYNYNTDAHMKLKASTF